jgi:hypothetical protein
VFRFVYPLDLPYMETSLHTTHRPGPLGLARARGRPIFLQAHSSQLKRWGPNA